MNSSSSRISVLMKDYFFWGLFDESKLILVDMLIDKIRMISGYIGVNAWTT